MIRLHAGHTAPDADVYTPEGGIVRISSLWATGVAAVVFPRHFG